MITTITEHESNGARPSEVKLRPSKPHSPDSVPPIRAGTPLKEAKISRRSVERESRGVTGAIKRLFTGADNLAIWMAIYAIICYCLPMIIAYSLFMLKFLILKSSARVIFNGSFFEELFEASTSTTASLEESLPLLAGYAILVQVILFMALIPFRDSQLYKVGDPWIMNIIQRITIVP